MKIIYKFRRYIAGFLLSCLVMSSISAFSTETVVADSNTLRKTYIDLMSGMRTINAADISQLTSKDLQCMAVYLSNFYVPYNTSLDGENNDAVVEAMRDALKKTGFDQESSEQFVNIIMQSNLSSAKQLYICASDFPVSIPTDGVIDDGTGEADDGASVEGEVDISSYSFGIGKTQYVDNSTTKVCIQPFEEVVEKEKQCKRTAEYRGAVGSNVYCGKNADDSAKSFTPLTAWIYNMILLDIHRGNINYPVSVYWGDATEMHKCFEFNDMTVSMIAMFSNKIGTDNGTALNCFINTSLEDFRNQRFESQKALSSITEKMYIDWAGNIIADLGSERVVVYPGCINPFLFGKLSDDDNNPTARWNMVSTWGAYFLSDIFGTVDNGSSYSLVPTTTSFGLQWTRGAKSEFDTGFFKNVWNQTDDGTGQVVKSFFAKMGFTVNDFEADDTKFDVSSVDGYVIDTNNSCHNYLTYLSLAAQTDFTNGSSFAESDALGDAELIGAYFNGADKFSKTSNDFSSFMQMTGSDNSSGGDFVMLANFFITYAFAFTNQGKSEGDSEAGVDLKYMGCFPDVLDTEVVYNEASTEADQEKVTSFIYYLLHPKEGVGYFVTLVKTKLGGLLISWHEDMVGGSDSNSTTGMTKYLSKSGYVTTPNLYEFEWLNSLLENYDNIIVYLIIFMGVILLCYILVGSMTLARAVIGLLLFAFLAFIPPVAINTTTDLINSVCDTMYSKKFDYWAYTQLHTYVDKLQQVNSAYTMTDYVNSMLDIQVSELEQVGGYGGVRVKWMTPKKFTDTAKAESEMEDKLEGMFSNYMVTLMSQMVATTTSTESYKDCVGQTYLYRDFMDIYTYGSTFYNLYGDYDLGGAVTTTCPLSGSFYGHGNDKIVNAINKVFNTMSYPSGKSLEQYLRANMRNQGSQGDVIDGTSSLEHTKRGFLVDTDTKEDGSGEIARGTLSSMCYYSKKRLATTYMVEFSGTLSRIQSKYNTFYNELYNSDGTPKSESNINLGSALANGKGAVFGLEPSEFCFTLNDARSGSGLIGDLDGFVYALYCESPYYFFNNNIRDQLSNYGSGLDYQYDSTHLSMIRGNMYKMLLMDKQKYFFNLTENAGDGYGELRDFMNMHDFFYYIMPMMQQGNYAVELWDDVFGMNVYSDCNLKVTAAGKIMYGGEEYGTIVGDNHTCKDALSRLVESPVWHDLNSEQKYKIWHNYNVWCLFNQYCTWLDTMQDCNYAKDEFISVMGERFHVLNPLDPTSYFTEENGEMTGGRYMVFSRSEMEYYGLDIADLTTVERKIIECQDNVYKQTLDLMNYYTLSDEVLINGVAMIETFEFNKIFSQSSIIGNDYMMYPQGYEAKAFTYDAYLRLIMSEASGDPIQVNGNNGETSIYRRIIKNTSIFYGVFLLFNDILSVYCIPLLRIAFLVMLFFISIALIVAASVKLELNLLTVIWKSILSPLLSYAGISIGFAFLVSMFMSNGADRVTQTSTTVNLGDPTMVLIVMIVINIAFAVLYFKICKKCFKDLKTYFEAIATGISSTVVGAMGALLGGYALGKRAGRKAIGAAGAIGSAASTAAQRGRDNMPGAGGSGLVASAGASAGASGVVDGLHANGLGLDSDEAKAGLDPAVREKLKKDDERAENKVGMNKYTAKAFDKSNAMADKAADASARHRKLAEKGGLAGKYHAWRSGGLERKKDFYNDKAKNLAENGGVSAAVRNAGSRIKYMASGGSLNIAGRNGNAFNNRSKQLNIMQEEHNAGVKNLQARRERQEAAWKASVDTNKRTQEMRQTQQDMQSTQNTMHTRQRNMNRTLTNISQERDAKF